ncbi:MAG: metallopeptidase family protein [Myxococcota bacterium]
MLDRDRYWDCLEQAHEASSGGRVDEALSWLAEALRANPRGAEAHNGRGEIFWDNGRYAQALTEFTLAVEADPTYYGAALNRIEILIEEFPRQEEALGLCDELLATSLEPLQGDERRSVEAELYYLKAKALFYLDDLEGALFLLRRALKVQGETGTYRGFEGQILFELGRFEAAQRSLERARILDPDSAHSLYHAALVAEQLGDFQEAEQLFARAASLAPDLYPLPVRISEQEFQAVVREAIDSLPAGLRRHVKDCPILVQDLPSQELIERERVSPQTLGLFEGVPLTQATRSGAGDVRVDHDCILLFKRNLEKAASERENLIEEIQKTVQHEIGHYLGLGEEEIEKLGLG